MRRLDFERAWLGLAACWCGQGVALARVGDTGGALLVGSNVERALRLVVAPLAAPPPAASAPSAEVVEGGYSTRETGQGPELSTRRCRFCGCWYAVAKGSRGSAGCRSCCPTIEDAIGEAQR